MGKDVYDIGELPPPGEVPPRMHAMLVRPDRFGDPTDAIRDEVIDVPELGGAYDRTQMEEVRRQWDAVPHNRWKIAAWDTIAPHLSGKVSTPYAPGSVHDYMHAKFLVVDDEVLAGSFNFSRHGEDNAENVLHLSSEHVAATFAAYAERVAARYTGVATTTRGDASGSAAGQT